MLKDYCDLEHYLQLFDRNNVLKTNRCGRTPDDFTLLEWLCILNLDPNRNNVVDDPIHSLNIAFEQMSSNDLNDDLIDVDSLNEERMLDDDFPSFSMSMSKANKPLE